MNKEEPKRVCRICIYGDGGNPYTGKFVEGTKDAPPHNLSVRGYDANDEKLPMCEKCKADGWIDNPEEIIKALNEDPLFQVGYESPITPLDL